MSAKKPMQVGNWNFDMTGETVRWTLDLEKVTAQMAQLEDRATLQLVLSHLRSKGFEITDPAVEEAKKRVDAEDDGNVDWQERTEFGWWEWGTQQHYSDGRPSLPNWYPTRFLAEQLRDRNPDKIDLIRRWVTPEPHETVVLRTEVKS